MYEKLAVIPLFSFCRDKQANYRTVYFQASFILFSAIAAKDTVSLLGL
jgi:hypothetical protein